MVEKKENIRESHAYRIELMEDIYNAKVEKLDYHIKQTKTYSNPVDPLGIVNRIKGDPLRSLKNHTISMNSMCCLTAEFGGMDAVTSHYQAEKYAILIEEAETEQKIIEISDAFLYEYLTPNNRPINNETLMLSEKINLFIGREFMNDITVQTIADYFFISREHASRVYRKETGDTVNNKIIAIRVEETKKFLTDTQMTITEIALRVGFNSSQYFSKVFKQLTGLTPTEFRNS